MQCLCFSVVTSGIESKFERILFEDYPIGQLLVWNTSTDLTLSRGNGELTSGNVNLVFDGQQRIKTLYVMIKGTPPKFFDGNANTIVNLYFHIIFRQ
mgnify:CR=1 FL=1